MSDSFPVFATLTGADNESLAGRRYHRMSCSVIQSWRKIGGAYEGYADAAECEKIEGDYLTPCRACIPAVTPPS